MSQETLRPLRLPELPAGAVRRWAPAASRVAAYAVAAWCGWHGYRLVYDDRFAIDRASLWYAGALLLLVYVAWDGARPNVAAWPRNVAAYVRAHPAELAVLGVVLAGGAFMRLFRFGDLPPNGYIILEEHINGGVAWGIMHGDRPYIYPSSRYMGALSQWIFGPSTTGLRAHSVAAGIASVLFFYLLMRELVARPAALFATAIFASLRVLGETSVHYQTPMLLVIVMVWLTVRGLRTGNIIWFVPASFLAAVASYEYETWKAVPIVLGGFFVFVALRGILLPPTRNVRVFAERVRAGAPHAALAAVVIGAAFLTGIGPMMAERHRGQDIYFSSLERQKGDREARGTPGLFAPDADKQITWALQAFTPWLKPDYVILGPNSTRGVVDKVTSALLWTGFIAAVAMFWRGARTLFVVWLAGGVIMAGLLLSNFAPWKVVGFLPPGIVLIGYLADDAFRVQARYAARLFLPLCAALALLAAGAFWFNARALNANANDERVLREYSNIPSQIFQTCENLRTRPEGTFAIVTQRGKPNSGFTKAPANDLEEAAAWGDYRFVCWGLRGQSAPDLQEAWPLFVDGDDDRPVSFSMVGGPDEMQGAVDAIRRVLPEIGDPDIFTTAPGAVFQTVQFDTTAGAVNARRGLVLRALTADGSATGEQVARGPRFDIDAAAAPDAVGYALSGLVFAPLGFEGVLEPLAAAAPPMVVTVDGSVAFDSVTGGGAAAPRPILEGWHLVEVRVPGRPQAPVELQWRTADGATVSPGDDGYFALADTGLWRHTRTYAGDAPRVTQRFDAAPHYAVYDGLRIGAAAALPIGTRATEERYSARWTVAGGQYNLYITQASGPVTFIVDGVEVVTTATGGSSVQLVELTPGDHVVELVFRDGGAAYIGGLFGVADATGHAADLNVRPF